MKELTLVHFSSILIGNVVIDNVVKKQSHLHELKKVDKSARILKKGKGRTRCGGPFTWAFFETTSEKLPLDILPDGYHAEKYFYSEEDRDEFIQKKLINSEYSIVDSGKLPEDNWYKVGELYYVIFRN